MSNQMLIIGSNGGVGKECQEFFSKTHDLKLIFEPFDLNILFLLQFVFITIIFPPENSCFFL